MCDTPEYWVRHVREAVRFADGVTTLVAAGVTRFVEVGPDAVLAASVAESAQDAFVVPVLRRNRDEESAIVEALARLHVVGVPVDWAAFYNGTGARRVELPTYAFQRERYWVHSIEGAGDLGAVGVDSVDHPLLGAVMWLPDGGLVLSGRVSVESHQWVADHAVLGRVLLPGTALVEMALRAGQEVGCSTVEELTLAAPFVLPEQGGVRVRVVVGGPEDSGRRTVGVYSFADGRESVCHASGFLVPGVVAHDGDLTEWPPVGARPVDVTGTYETFAEHGFGYGPVFQGLRAVWEHGDDLYAEVALPEQAVSDADRFGIHPALFDACMHALLSTLGDTDRQTVIPFVWSDVSLFAVGASVVRVRLGRTDDGGTSIVVADAVGQIVVTVGSMRGRPVSVEQLGSSGGGVWGVEWSPVSGPSEAWTRWPEPGPVVVLDCADFDVHGDVPERVRAVLAGVLGAVRDWLADERFAGARLVVNTHSAVAVTPGESVDVVQAPVWGLVRSAMAENPGRFGLVDGDVWVGDEPEAAVRDGRVWVPRLTRLPVPEERVEFDPEGAVLITGGTGGVGGVMARYLVAERGVRRLVLTSRRGMAAEGAAELVAGLAELGAEVDVVACDVSDRAAVEALVHGIAGLSGVVHAAGTGDNGLVTALTPERFETVLAAKADGAWYLHEATREMDLRAFVLVSSAGGLVLVAGQANYAAANVFVDGLAAARRAAGLPGTSMAFGLWDVGGGLGQYLREVDRRRMATQGVPALSLESGLAMFGTGLDSSAALVVAIKVDVPALRSRKDEVPALLRGLAGPVRRAAVAVTTGSWLDRVAGLGAGERRREILQLVRGQVAEILGYGSAEAVAPDRAFQELGFDSLAATDLRNRLNAATGLRLPATLVFDHPSTQAVTEYIEGELAGHGDVATGTDDEVQRALRSIPTSRLRDAGLMDSLLELAEVRVTAADIEADDGDVNETAWLREQNRKLAASLHEPIAIVGHGLPVPRRCDQPGGVVAAGDVRWGRRSPSSRTTVAGTCPSCGTRTPTTRTSTTPARVASWPVRPPSTPASSASRRARRWPWTRSSG